MKTSSRISMRVAAALLMAATLAGGCVMQKLGYVKKSTHDDLADQYTQAAAELNRLKMDNEAIGSMNEKDQAEARRLGAELANAQSTIADLQAQLEQASQPQTDPELLAIREQLKRLTGTGGLEWNDLKGTLVLRLHFALGRADIQDEDKAPLQAVAEKLKEIPPSYIIYIDGHTDDLPVKNPATVEAHRDLWGLGANRALTVLRALEGMAVDGSQMLPRSFAAYDPIDPAKTPAARRKNRRVEISVEPKPGSSTAEPAAIE